MTLTETGRAQTRQAVAELLAAARMRAGDIFIIGCSSSEVVGQRIGRGSSMEAQRLLGTHAADDAMAAAVILQRYLDKPPAP